MLEHPGYNQPEEQGRKDTQPVATPSRVLSRGRRRKSPLGIQPQGPRTIEPVTPGAPEPPRQQEPQGNRDE